MWDRRTARTDVRHRRSRLGLVLALGVHALVLAAVALHGWRVLRTESTVYREAGVIVRNATSGDPPGPLASDGAFFIGYYAQRGSIALPPDRFGAPAAGDRETGAALCDFLRERRIRSLVIHPLLLRAHPELRMLSNPARAPACLGALAANHGRRIIVYETR